MHFKFMKAWLIAEIDYKLLLIKKQKQKKHKKEKEKKQKSCLQSAWGLYP